MIATILAVVVCKLCGLSFLSEKMQDFSRKMLKIDATQKHREESAFRIDEHI